MLLTVIIMTLIAGMAMPVGAVIARFERLESRWAENELRHGVMAFGAGALLSAVGLVLVPEGIEPFAPLLAVLWFFLGSCAFMALDIYLTRKKTPASQLTAMLSDFIPESLALGAAFATGNENALALALLIALQNLPEGFNAYTELNQSAVFKSNQIIFSLTAMAVLGPVAGVSGYLWLSDYPEIVAAVMLFASGGILYSIFQDIAPQVKLEQHWTPPMGAILGFALGMVGLMLTS